MTILEESQRSLEVQNAIKSVYEELSSEYLLEHYVVAIEIK